MSDFFNKQNNICSDDCWRLSKDNYNNNISSYQIYPTNLVECKTPNVRMPDFSLDHLNLRGRPGYGLVESCLVDQYNNLVSNSESMTRDKCRLQLNGRLFTGCPSFKGSIGDINKELDILSGSDTNPFKCKKTIMENQIKHPIPLVDCMKDIQNPEHIVPNWVNGGEDTRSYINRLNFNKKC